MLTLPHRGSGYKQGRGEGGLTTEDLRSHRTVLHQTYKHKLRRKRLNGIKVPKLNGLKREIRVPTNFFHGMASSCQSVNRTISLIDGDSPLSEDEISKAIVRIFHQLYVSWDRADPKLDNLEFDCIGDK